MKIYQVIITNTLIDYSDNETYNRDEKLNFQSNELRTEYLNSYLFPFLNNMFKEDNLEQWYWLGDSNKFKVIYSYELNKFDIDIIKSIPTRAEREFNFINNVFNKHIDNYDGRLKMIANNPIEFHNLNSSPTRFDIDFPKLKIY